MSAASFPWFVSVLTMVSTPEPGRHSTEVSLGKLMPLLPRKSCAGPAAGIASGLSQ